jgi:hypothetical protein
MVCISVAEKMTSKKQHVSDGKANGSFKTGGKNTLTRLVVSRYSQVNTF